MRVYGISLPQNDGVPTATNLCAAYSRISSSFFFYIVNVRIVFTTTHLMDDNPRMNRKGCPKFSPTKLFLSKMFSTGYSKLRPVVNCCFAHACQYTKTCAGVCEIPPSCHQRALQPKSVAKKLPISSPKHDTLVRFVVVRVYGPLQSRLESSSRTTTSLLSVHTSATQHSTPNIHPPLT